MKFFIVFAALFAVALAAPTEILRQESEVGPEYFQYAYETSDGVVASAQGQLKNIGKDEEAIVVQGSFSFVGDDGQIYTVNYVADENGYQPQGAHLPVGDYHESFAAVPAVAVATRLDKNVLRSLVK